MAMIENILKTPTTIEVVFDAKMSNPNGDPDNENAPRQNSEGFGYKMKVWKAHGFNRGMKGRQQ